MSDTALWRRRIPRLPSFLSCTQYRTSWEDLYKAYEIIKDARGGQKAVEQLGVTGRQISHFKGSANLERHARPTGRPANPMALPEGQQFIRDLAERWFRTLENDGS